MRVVEFGGKIAAAYATKLLAELGADVTKAEPPEGDPMRSFDAGLFRFLNAAKRTVAADAAAVECADVVVESLGPGELERVVGDVKATSFVRISDFGQNGPYAYIPSSGLIVQALGGWV